MSGAAQVCLGWMVFIGTHLFFSHPPVRAPLVAACGSERDFKLAYSMLSFLLMAPLVAAWWRARAVEAPLWWVERPSVRLALELASLLGFALIGGGLSGRRQAAALSQDGMVVGLPALVRHPPFAGVLVWSLAHLTLNGRPSDAIFFFGFALMVVLGGAHRDWRRARAEPAYGRFVAQTSWWPRLSWSRLARVGARAWAGCLLGLASGLLIHALHPRVFG